MLLIINPEKDVKGKKKKKNINIDEKILNIVLETKFSDR